MNPRNIVLLGLLLGGCAHRVTVDPIRVEPIYVTLEVTIKVDNRLDEFFAFEDDIEREVYGGDQTEGGLP